MTSDRRKAIKIYESFREKSPRSVAVFTVDVPSAVACIGHIEAVDYRTTHGKKLALYRHAFAAGSRPLMCVSADGRSLWLLGGRFKFTARGIVDRDAKGREIENAKHGKRLNPKAAPVKGYIAWNYWDHVILARTASWKEADAAVKAAIAASKGKISEREFGIEAVENIHAKA